MSYQPPQPVAPQRVRHENAQSLNLSGGTKEILFTLGAIGVGALGGYFVIDYIIRNNVLGLGGPAAAPPAPEPAPASSARAQAYLSNIEIQEPYDRYTRVNSYQAAVNAYRGEQARRRLTTMEVPEEEDEITDDSPNFGFNQVFTEDRVYEV